MQLDQPLLTIAIPTYNRELYLKTLLYLLEPQVLGEPRLELIVSDNASYPLRAHKLEPFLPVSIALGVLMASSTLLMGKVWGASGVTLGYFITSGIFGLAFGTFIFMTKRQQWHKAFAFEGSSTL